MIRNITGLRRLLLAGLRLFVVPILTLAPPASGQSAQNMWAIDPDTARITFAFQEFGKNIDSSVKGFTASIAFNPSQLNTGKARVTFPVSAMSAGQPERDQMLKGTLWLDEANHPQITYQALDFSLHADGSYIAHGELTIRDKTLPIDLPFALTINSDSAGDRARVSGQTSFSRLAFDLGRGEWLQTNIIGDTITVHIDIQATRRP